MNKLLFSAPFLLLCACSGGETPGPMQSSEPGVASPQPAPQPTPGAVPEPGAVPTPESTAPTPGGEGLIGEGDDETDTAASGIHPGDPVDLLFVVDNSTSMGDKQALFADAVPDLIDMLVHPPCLDNRGDQDEANDTLVAFAEDGSCPTGTKRVFAPVTDIHIGVISSSLGAHGLVTSAENPEGFQCPDTFHQNDRAYLIPLARPEAPDILTNSYQGLGFLVWDPSQKATPPGDTDQAALVAKFQAQVTAVRETGCGFEAPMEAAYRFLVDPAPYASLSRVACSETSTELNCVAPTGVDNEVLVERQNFLRPNSHLVVTLLTDENDCSIRDSGQGYYAMRPVSMSRGTNACATNPNDNCCQSCGARPREGCEQDPALNGCSPEPALDAMEMTEDQMSEAYNVRCFDQKRRFGMDFLYPVARYTEGFTKPMITSPEQTLVPNPLFQNGRTPEKVFVVGIVGTPWQDVTLDQTDPAGTVPRAAQLNWDLFLPTETNGGVPSDPFNRESTLVRDGANPVTGDVLGGPDTSNAINGFDRTIASGDGLLDDLQYACTFTLPMPRDCTAMGVDDSNCDCTRDANPVNGAVLDYATGNPLCLAPDGTYGTTQYKAKAYPGTRVMQLVKDMGQQAVLGSICPRNPLDPSLQDYGYRPPIRALLLGLSRGVL